MKVHCVIVVALLMCAAWAQEPPALPKIQDSLKEGVTATESSLADQTDVAVTIYNNDLALVRDKRKIKLLPGEQSLRFMDVAQKVRPETVSLKSLTAPGSLAILEQNYEFDLISPSKLMEKYVGKPVRLVNFNNQIGFTEKDAELLSVNEGPVFKVGEEIYLGMPGQVVLPKIPDTLIAKPSLVWLLHNVGTDHDVEVTYLTAGIAWRADYVLTLAKDEKTLDVEGWVTLNNQSGAQYSNAQLKVVAGEVNVVPAAQPMPEMAAGRAMKLAAAPAPMREETFAEYHLYTLPRRTTIKENESKQVSLLTASGASVKKVYEYRGNVMFYSQRIPPQAEEKVGVFLVLRNSDANHLGMPLPAGVMRVYQQDNDGMLQFAGEDHISCNSRARTTSSTRRKTRMCGFAWATLSTSSASASKRTSRRSPRPLPNPRSRLRFGITRTSRSTWISSNPWLATGRFWRSRTSSSRRTPRRQSLPCRCPRMAKPL
ncbi:MAG: DUF4139 domain-containing protein [Candidatus Hydrogenedentes bacterium]|nr:DUF4139 domain-containing protein [Candidatus Hydrogenedentota bacterium]